MYILRSESNSAYFNLAIEEYFLNNFSDDFFIIDVNEPSIVLGINQNAYEEINALYVKQSSIKLVRRLSGGGSIFQDAGNLNFSYIYEDDGSDFFDMSKILNVLSGFLKEKLNINITFQGNKHILIAGKKIGGYTKLRFNNRILVHCSLIFSSNKKFLIDALKISKSKHPDRALRSTHTNVTSISEHLHEKISMNKFKEMFFSHVHNSFENSSIFELSENDKEKINALIKEKYSTWEWCYGQEFSYNYKSIFISNSSKVEIFLQIENNLIKNSRFCGDFFSQKNIKELEILFVDCPYEIGSVTKIVSEINLNSYIENIDNEVFIAHFFSGKQL
jgi:lipoate-protein ligase A